MPGLWLVLGALAASLSVSAAEDGEAAAAASAATAAAADASPQGEGAAAAASATEAAAAAAHGTAKGGGVPEWAYVSWKARGSTEDEEDEDAITADADDGDDDDGLTPSSPTTVSFQLKLPADCKEGLVPISLPQTQFRCCLSMGGVSYSQPDHTDAIRYLAMPQLGPGDSVRVTTLLQRLMPSGQSIVWNTGGWWTYEFCPGRYLRQYHAEKGVLQSEYVLGVGSMVLTGHTCANTVAYPDGKTTTQKKILRTYSKKKIAATGRWKVEGVAGSAPYFSTTYTDGEICDLTSKPREVKLIFRCLEGSGQAEADASGLAFSIKETGQCQYEAVVAFEALCQLPIYTAVNSYLNQGDDVSPRLKARRARARRAAVLAMKAVPGVDAALIQELGPEGCITLQTGGWWSYELCIRYWLRQYHEAEVGAVETEYFIGRGVDVNGKGGPLARAQQHIGKTGGVVVKRMSDTAKLPHPVKANGTWTAHGELVRPPPMPSPPHHTTHATYMHRATTTSRLS